jgi:glutathione S-transferase
MKHAGLEFDEVRIALNRPQTTAEILRHSPSARVPCLIDGGLTVWDSIAICEYVNERHAGGRLWPSDAAQRARARSVAAEMHAGFAALRTHMPMDIRGRHADRGAAAAARADVAADIRRIEQVWSDCLTASSGPLLFGSFSIADAFFAPVVTRFVTYGVTLPPPLAAFSDEVRALPAMRQWSAAAADETETIAS